MTTDMKKPSWTIERKEKHLWVLNLPSKNTPPILLMSDEHWDNAHADLDLIKKHHSYAKALNAPIFKFGDTFCAMQGKWDRRADQNQLREEHRGNNYLDKLVETADDFYGPYKDNIALITDGNHEGSICERHQTDLVKRLGASLWGKDFETHTGPIWGFVIIRLLDYRGKCEGHRVLHFHHGYGGGGEITRGLIDQSRTRSQYDADIYYSGHIHRRNQDENILTRVDPVNAKIVTNPQIFLRGSCYKDETDGWHASKGRASRPLGGWWLRVFLRHKGKTRIIDTQEVRAGETMPVF